jgi:hypothetical protein
MPKCQTRCSVTLLVIYGKFLLAADGDARLASGGCQRRADGQRVEVRIVDSHAGERAQRGAAGGQHVPPDDLQWTPADWIATRRCGWRLRPGQGLAPPLSV